MQIERELAHIVTPIAKKKVRVFWRSQKKLIRSVYSGLRSGAISTDSAASLAVFGEIVDANRFRAFKSRFRERLLHSLFFLELNASRNGAYATDIYKLHKQVFWIRILAMFGARNTALYLCQKSLKSAEYYQLTFVQIELLEFLGRHYALTGKRKAFARMNLQIEKRMDVLRAEQISSRMYQALSMEYVKSAVPKQELLELTRKYNAEASELAERYHTYSINLDSIRIGILFNQVTGQFPSTLQLCDSAETYFKNHQHLTPTARYGELELHRLESYLYLRNYEMGSETAQKCALYFPIGRNNWFLYMEYYFLLAMHTLRFEQANAIFVDVTTNARFTLQRESVREKWRVFEICLSYANRAINANTAAAIEIDVDHLLETVPIYTKDKQGYNVPILVMHILLLLERGDLDAITQRMEALRTYRSRYLRAKTNRHSALFFKLLIIMESSSFDLEVITTKGAKYYQQLKTSPSAYTEVHEGVQILSYAWLWERVLERLELMQDKLVST